MGEYLGTEGERKGVNQQTNMIQMQRTVEQGRAIEKKMEK